MKLLKDVYQNCTLCPRNCGTNRAAGETGFCGMPAKAYAASAVLHRGEEPPLTGGKGSGAVFFTGCTLGCPFCQNIQISREGLGAGLSEMQLAEIFIELQNRGAVNINLVTATQFIPDIIKAASEARRLGLRIPLMWNSSGYESAESIELLKDAVDIWLPDIKTLDSALADRFFSASDYPQSSVSAIKKMAEITEEKGGTVLENDIMKRGMIVRHLVMPGELESTREVLKWFSEEMKNRAFLSVMVQYTSINDECESYGGRDYVMPDSEYNQLLGWLEEFGIDEGFLQSPEAASPEWIPDFNRKNPFPAEYSDPVWHHSCGFLQQK